MTAPQISLPPADRPDPARNGMPLEGAWRWYTQHEPAADHPGFGIFVEQAAYLRATMHACSDLGNEVGGMLLGRWGPGSDGTRAYIVVETTLEARFTEQGAAHLTFTQDSLVDFHNRIDEQYPGLQIVGWYHTHPRMAVFLSHYDTWLHRHFFPEPWQVALVIEPAAYTGGFFVRDANGELDPQRPVGFYEMVGQEGRSVVHWRNLSRTPVPPSEGGE